MGQIYSRAVIDSIHNLDRLWTFGFGYLWTFSLKHRTLLIIVTLDDNNDVATHIHYSMQIHINVM